MGTYDPTTYVSPLFTAGCRRTIIDALQGGATCKHACALARVSIHTYYKWLKHAGHPAADQVYRTFSEDVDAARAGAATKLLRAAHEGALSTDGKIKDWKIARWLLENVHGYSAHKIIEQRLANHDGTGPATVIIPGLEALTIEQLRALAGYEEEIDAEPPEPGVH